MEADVLMGMTIVSQTQKIREKELRSVSSVSHVWNRRDGERRKRKQGNTIALVTHERDIAAYAHRIVHIKNAVLAKHESKR